MMLYIDEPGLAGLLQQAEGGALIETNALMTSESGESAQAGIEAGGGFMSVLGLAKLSGLFSKTTKTAQTDGQRFAVGSNSHLAQLIELLRESGAPRFFESLDAAFSGVPENGTTWVCVRDTFALMNLGGDLRFEALNREQRFLFEIDPARNSHSNRDDYFKNPPRKWHLSMAASFERCPRLKGRSFGLGSHEGIYFRTHGYTSIPLHVFGYYLRTGLRIQIIPYAIWI